MMFTENQPAKALALAQQYAAANPNRVQAMFIYAGALATNKKYDQSLAEYQKAATADPKNAAAYLHMGQIYQVMGKPDAALDSYQKALAFSRPPPRLTTRSAMLTWRRAT